MSNENGQAGCVRTCARCISFRRTCENGEDGFCASPANKTLVHPSIKESDLACPQYESAVLVIATGGTAEFNYAPSGDLIFEKSVVPEMIKRARARINIGVKTLCLKDSRDLTDADRKTIVRSCLESAESRVIVVHGTDTVHQTFEMMATETAGTSKTVVFTGAFLPAALGRESDFPFNFGAALAIVQVLPAGCYLCINGQILRRFRKDRLTWAFEAAETE
jgi:L-asparaginase